MKFIATLPENKHYRPLQSQVEGRFLWQDKGSNSIRIVAPTPNPWGKEWVILPSIQKAKNDTYQYPARLDLKCLEPIQQEIKRANLVREVMRGKFAHPQASLHTFFVFPIQPNQKTLGNPEQIWLMYLFYI